MTIKELRREQNQNILSYKEQIGQRETKVSELVKRAEVIRVELEKVRAEYEKIKQAQAEAIATGNEDYISIGHNVKEKLHDVEVFEGALTTVQELKAGEEKAIKDLNAQINLCLIELDKLEAVEIVDRYNKVAAELAEVFKDYDRLSHSISSKYSSEMLRGRSRGSIGFDVLGYVARTEKGVTGYGLPVINLLKVVAVIPGETADIPTSPEFHFNYRTDRIVY